MIELTVNSSKAGRPKVSVLSRKEQVAKAQKDLRDRKKKEGLKTINVSVNSQSKIYLDSLCQIHSLTQKEVIEKLIEKAIKEGVLI